jgi:hypothetical protein
MGYAHIYSLNAARFEASSETGRVPSYVPILRGGSWLNAREALRGPHL